jgi:hypothetical protein
MLCCTCAFTEAVSHLGWLFRAFCLFLHLCCWLNLQRRVGGAGRHGWVGGGWWGGGGASREERWPWQVHCPPSNRKHRSLLLLDYGCVAQPASQPASQPTSRPAGKLACPILSSPALPCPSPALHCAPCAVLAVRRSLRCAPLASYLRDLEVPAPCASAPCRCRAWQWWRTCPSSRPTATATSPSARARVGAVLPALKG